MFEQDKCKSVWAKALSVTKAQKNLETNIECSHLKWRSSKFLKVRVCDLLFHLSEKFPLMLWPLTLRHPLCPQPTLHWGQTHSPGTTLIMAHNKRWSQVWFLALIQRTAKRNTAKKDPSCLPSFLSLQPFHFPPSVPVSCCVCPNYAANKKRSMLSYFLVGTGREWEVGPGATATLCTWLP